MKMTAQKVTNYYPRRHSNSPYGWRQRRPSHGPRKRTAGASGERMGQERIRIDQAMSRDSGNSRTTSDSISGVLCPKTPNLSKLP
jgi:hypothetical protein